MSLRDLDERLVPAMAAWLDRLLDRLPTPPEPAGPAPLIVRLRRVDDRWTRRGPLAAIREVPQLGAVAVMALVFAGATVVEVRTVHTRERNGATPTASAPADPGADTGHLGPQIGDKVLLYRAAARDNLNRLAISQPDGVVIAVISFSSYRTLAETRDLLGPIPVKRVFYRAPLPINQTSARSVAVEDLMRDGRKEFDRVAAVQRAAAAELTKVARTIQNDPVQRADQERDALIYSREAAILKGPCDCVFAVAVRTKLRLLVDLAGQPAVRVIDASRPGAKIEDFDLSGLLPEEKVTVTGGNQAG
jgi:hypothetical protein